MIDLNKSLAIWFMDVSDTANWLASLSTTDDGKIWLQWRMRYYERGSAPDSKDRSNWYEGAWSKTLPEALEAVRNIARVLTQHAEGELYELIRGDMSADEFFERFHAMPWVHVSAYQVDRSGT